MGAFALHFTQLALHNMTSIFFLSLGQLAHTQVSHDSGWHAHACSVHNNFSLYTI